MAKRRGEVVAIKDLFAKYRQTLKAPQKSVEMELIRAVGEVVGVTLKEESVSYTVATRTVAIRASSLIKQEIRLREKEVIQNLKKVLGDKNSPEHII